MTPCREILPLLGAWVEGSLPESEGEIVEAHLAGCLECGERVARRRRLHGLLNAGLAVPDPGEAYFRMRRERLLEAVKPSPAPFGATLKRLVPIAALLAAACLLILFGPGLLSNTAGRRNAVAPSETARPEPGTGPANQRPPSSEGLSPEALRGPTVSSVRPPAPPPGPTLREPGPEARVEVPGPALLRQSPSPGSAERLVRMTSEAVEVALAETPAERVTALCAAAEAQLEELRRFLDKDPALASEMAAAYRVLVLEGVASVLLDPAEPAEDRAAARQIAARRAQNHEKVLQDLGGEARGPLKESLALALAASRELTGR